MASINPITVLEHSHVSPPASTISDTSLPLTFLDTFWVNLSNINRLIFYEFPHPEIYFLDSIVPKLKRSLALALKQFYILAGRLVIPSDSSIPRICYENGNSVSLIFARSDSIDFDYLIANGARNCSEFYPLVPEIEPQTSDSSDSTIFPLLSLQITLFPNVGISIGVTNHHVIGDANAIFRFVKAWSILSSCGETPPLPSDLLPFYDRSVIKDPKGLLNLFWNQLGSIAKGGFYPQRLSSSTDKVRGTFIINSKNVQRLKNSVLSAKHALLRVSTFSVVCAYIWSCIVKSRAAIEDIEDDGELEHFGFVADSRGRLDPKVPENYFGNCLIFCVATAKHREIAEDRGFIFGAELIAESINERMNSKEGVLKDAENWFSNAGGMNMKRVVSIAGSPRYNYYELDFGFGKAKKFEFISIDMTGAMALSAGSESEQDVEVGLSFPKERMDAFTTAFNEGLKDL